MKLKALLIIKSAFTCNPDIHEQITIDFKNFDLMFGKIYGQRSCKPILRPFDDIFKNIDYNGNKIILSECLFPINVEEENKFNIDGILPEYWENVKKIESKYYDYWQMLILFKYHIDVFKLINSGNAIDINTLK